MGILGGYNRSAFDYYWQHSDRENFFILSDINSNFMKKHNLGGTVKEFKNKVRKSQPFTRVRTGSANYNYRSTPLYRVSDFKK